MCCSGLEERYFSWIITHLQFPPKLSHLKGSVRFPWESPHRDGKDDLNTPDLILEQSRNAAYPGRSGFGHACGASWSIQATRPYWKAAHGRPCPGCWERSTPSHLLELITWRGRNTKGKRACDSSTISGLGRKRKLGKKRVSGKGEVPLRQGGPSRFSKEAKRGNEPCRYVQRRSVFQAAGANPGAAVCLECQEQQTGQCGPFCVRPRGAFTQSLGLRRGPRIDLQCGVKPLAGCEQGLRGRARPGCCGESRRGGVMLSGYPGMNDPVSRTHILVKQGLWKSEAWAGPRPTWKQTLGTSEPNWAESRCFRFSLPRVDGQYRGACAFSFKTWSGHSMPRNLPREMTGQVHKK